MTSAMFRLLGRFHDLSAAGCNNYSQGFGRAERKLDRTAKRKFWCFESSYFHRFFNSLHLWIKLFWECGEVVRVQWYGWYGDMFTMFSQCRTYLRCLLPTMQTFLSLHRSRYHWAHLSTSRSGLWDSLSLCNDLPDVTGTQWLPSLRTNVCSGYSVSQWSTAVDGGKWLRQNSNFDHDLQLETGWSQVYLPSDLYNDFFLII